jgi:hypothetical protein
MLPLYMSLKGRKIISSDLESTQSPLSISQGHFYLIKKYIILCCDLVHRTIDILHEWNADST